MEDPLHSIVTSQFPSRFPFVLSQNLRERNYLKMTCATLGSWWRFRRPIEFYLKNNDYQSLGRHEVPKNQSPVKETSVLVKPFNWRPWYQVSISRREQIKKLHNDSEAVCVGNLTYRPTEEFLIAKGNFGIEVFLGLRNDGTEVAIKKCKANVLKHEEAILRLARFEHSSILQYVDAAKDDEFFYLAVKLYEHTVEEYVKINTTNVDRVKMVSDVLKGLKVLHHNHPPILHGNITEQTVVIDVTGQAKLADFSQSRYLVCNPTTSFSRNDEEQQRWIRKENVEDETAMQNKLGLDIKMAGELCLYVLSGGHHLPVDTLGHVEDGLEMDLVEGMTNEDTQKRLKIEPCLQHPLFWTPARRVRYLKSVGNRDEAVNCRNADQELTDSLEQRAADASKQWKNKFPRELVQEMEKVRRKRYPQNTLGLLRFIRNLHEHHVKDAAQVDVMTLFPGLFLCVYKFAQTQGWNSQTPLKEEFSTNIY